MITAKSAKTKMNAVKAAAVEQMSHITTNEKIAGAAVIGVAVGAAATATGSSLLHGSTAEAASEAKAPKAAVKAAPAKG
jgi:hypothetical protein